MDPEGSQYMQKAITSDYNEGEFCKRIRMSRGLSQREMVQIASSKYGVFVSQASVSLIERGKAKCPPEFAEVLNQMSPPRQGRDGSAYWRPCLSANTRRVVSLLRRPGETVDAALRRLLGTLEGGDTMTFGECVKSLRIRRGETLRSFCLANKYDAGYVSKLERGILPPPADYEDLHRYARALGVVYDSEQWHQLLQLAAEERSKPPIRGLEDDDYLIWLPLPTTTYMMLKYAVRNGETVDTALRRLLAQREE